MKAIEQFEPNDIEQAASDLQIDRTKPRTLRMLQSSAILSSGNAVYITGQGDPIVTICGGPGLSSRMYQKYLGRLASNHQLIFWDYAGTGSSVSRSEYSTEADYQDFATLLNQLGVKRANILAHSYGGLLALRHAIERPEQISKLILVGTAAHLGPLYADGLERKKAKLSPAEFNLYMAAVQQLLSGSHSPEHVSDFLRMEIRFQSYRSLSSEEERQFVQDVDLSLPAFVLNKDWPMMDLTPRLKEIDVPTLVMTSTHDAAVPPRYSKALAAIPNVKFFEFKESGHWPFLDETELFHRELESFLSGQA